MRTSSSQFECLVDFMERHGDLNKPAEGPQGRITNYNRWTELIAILNADATGDRKSPEKWRKVWSDLKNNTKRKAARCFRDASGIDGGPAVKLKLTNLEQRVLNIIGSQAATGLVTVAEIGLDHNIGVFGTTPNDEVEVMVEPVCEFPLVFETSTSTQQDVKTNEPQLIQETELKTSPQSHRYSRQRVTGRRRVIPLSLPRKMHSATHAELASSQFSKSDAEWRLFQREKSLRDYELEKERLRLREIELQQQATWQELFAQLLSIANMVAEKYVDEKD